jgi:carboxylesterase type B
VLLTRICERSVKRNYVGICISWSSILDWIDGYKYVHLFPNPHKKTSASSSRVPKMFFRSISVFALFVELSLSSLTSRIAPSAPTVSIKNGSYVGYFAPAYNTDSKRIFSRLVPRKVSTLTNQSTSIADFLGMPYAQPPVGDLRYRIPQSLNSTWAGTRSAAAYGPECFGYGLDTESQGNIVSEDCLTINVIRPANVTGNLPVGFWIHGGGLYEGGGADHRYNLSFIVQRSAELGSPIMGVSINYRLSAWGFLYGKEVQASGQTMLGYRDQRLALHWVKENIAAFGGDPNKVTIWGQSAGASSVAVQMLAYNGRDDGIIAGAISESGTAASMAPYATVQTWQPIYNNIAAAAGCNSSSDSLACLRTIPTAQMNSIINSTITASAKYGAVIDGDFVQQPASVQLQKGNFIKVPYLVGNNADEGTMFGPHGVNTTTDYLNYLKSVQFVDNETATIMSYLYPDIPSVGVPGTWHGKPPATAAFGTQYKRSSLIAGDIQEHATRRLAALSWAAQNATCYTYYFDVLVNGQPYTTGSTHFQEVAFVFYNTEGYGYPQNLLPNPLAGVLRSRYLALAKIMSAHWIGFISTGNPNSAPNQAAQWPRYSVDAPMAYFYSANVTSVPKPDNYRPAGINYIMDLILARQGRNCSGLTACGAPAGILDGSAQGPPNLQLGYT